MNINAGLASIKTNLPAAVIEQAYQTVPQHDAISWAFWAGRTMLRGEPTTATLVLVGYAQYASAALCSGDGYNYITPEAVANLIGMSSATVRRYTKVLVAKRLLIQSHLSGVTLNLAAWDGEWLEKKAADYRL